VWVAKEPHKSNINYFAPTQHTAKRLELYGVPKQNITVTGFPLPKELIGGVNQKILKQDLHRRLQTLDVQKNFEQLQKDIIPKKTRKQKKEQLTILYAIGGAGAHKKIAKQVLQSLAPLIRQKKIKLIITCGTKLNIAQELQQVTLKLQIEVHIQSSLTQTSYFEEFNTLLRQTDVLWTKPSELSFYCGLGIPIIISPPLGEHEHYNKRWLEQIGAGLSMDNPKYAQEWIMDWWQRGLFAKASVDGYMLAPKMGTYNIQKIIAKQ
jgi:UDP-N-acetylglucosamine:LPS N-acetylglucosamine transferase